VPTSSHSVLQWEIPKSVGNALDVHKIAANAKAAGIEKTRFEYSEYRTAPNRGRISCQVSLAPIIIDAISELAGQSQGQLVLDCAAAAMAGLSALEKAGKG
jgi:hypothetical protein